MSPKLDYTRVLHLGDPAHTATFLTSAANASGRNWRVLQLAKSPAVANPTARAVLRAMKGLSWEACLFVGKTLRSRIHLHQAMALPHAGWALGDYMLHLHGTEIRSRRYETRYEKRLYDAVAGAHHVFYSTPDLREHIVDWRPEAQLIPVPVALDSAQVANPYRSIGSPAGSYVFFTSRWEAVKGGETQIAAARALRARLPQSVALVGLDWGDEPLREAAREAGVHLIPKQPGAAYRQVVREAKACVGQTAGILSASELESLVENVPLVVPLNPNWYDGSHPSLRDMPVLGGTTLDPADSEGIANLTLEAIETKPATRDWVKRFHSPTAALEGVLDGYRATDW